MEQLLIKPLKLKDLTRAIEAKAMERNREMGRDFYSLNASDYAYEDIIEYDTYKLMLFVCPKSNSTISIKIYDKPTHGTGIIDLKKKTII